MCIRDRSQNGEPLFEPFEIENPNAIPEKTEVVLEEKVLS